jgi:uncharacterized damage-inducible protein DinB
MNYYGGSHLARSFRTVRGNTLTIAEEIPEEQYNFRATPDTRSVAQLLTHIGVGHRLPQTIHQIERRTTLEGFNFPAFMQQQAAEEQKARSKAEIIDLLRSEGDRFASWLDGLSEDFLAEQVKSVPGTQPAVRSRFEMLLSPKEHEMHHRAQLMLIQRMIGITPHLTRQMQERMAQMDQVTQTARS